MRHSHVETARTDAGESRFRLVVNGFSPAIGNSFQVLALGSRTGQFATINGLAIGNPIRLRSGHPRQTIQPRILRDQSHPQRHRRRSHPHSARQRWRRHSRRAGTPRPFDSAQGTRGTDPHDPASFFRISKIEKSATGTQLQFGTATGNPSAALRAPEPIASNAPTT